MASPQFSTTGSTSSNVGDVLMSDMSAAAKQLKVTVGAGADIEFKKDENQLDSIKDLKEKPLDKMLSAEHKSILELAVHQAESYSDGVQMTAMVEALGNRLQADNKKAITAINGAMSIPQMLSMMMMDGEHRVSSPKTPLKFTWVAFTKLDEHDEEEDEPEEEFDGGELVLTDSRLMFMASTIDHSAKFETDGAAKKKPPTCWSDFLDRITPKWYTEWQEKKKAEEEEERKLKEAKAKAKGAKVSFKKKFEWAGQGDDLKFNKFSMSVATGEVNRFWPMPLDGVRHLSMYSKTGSVAKTKISRKVECCLEPMCFSFCKPMCNKCLYFMCWGICGPCKTENTKEIKEEVEKVMQVDETACFKCCGCNESMILGKTIKNAQTVAEAERIVSLAVCLPPWGHHYNLEIKFHSSVSLVTVTEFLAHVQRLAPNTGIVRDHNATNIHFITDKGPQVKTDMSRM